MYSSAGRYGEYWAQRCSASMDRIGEGMKDVLIVRVLDKASQAKSRKVSTTRAVNSKARMNEQPKERETIWPQRLCAANL